MAAEAAALQLKPEAKPQPTRLPAVQEGLRVNRGACAAGGALAGWIPLSCCSIGPVGAIATGMGFGTAYFAANNTLFFGLGWTPIWALVMAGFVLVASYVVARPAFANYPRDVATRHFWRTAGFMGLAGGITFILWMEVIMPILFIGGVPMGALFPPK